MHVGGGFSGLMIEIKENQSRVTSAQSQHPVRVHDVQGVFTDADGNILNVPRLSSKQIVALNKCSVQERIYQC